VGGGHIAATTKLAIEKGEEVVETGQNEEGLKVLASGDTEQQRPSLHPREYVGLVSELTTVEPFATSYYSSYPYGVILLVALVSRQRRSRQRYFKSTSFTTNVFSAVGDNCIQILRGFATKGI
jgi:hypothetical protein